ANGHSCWHLIRSFLPIPAAPTLCQVLFLQELRTRATYPECNEPAPDPKFLTATQSFVNGDWSRIGVNLSTNYCQEKAERVSSRTLFRRQAMAASISSQVIESFLKCRYKAALKLAGETGQQSAFELFERECQASALGRVRQRLATGSVQNVSLSGS